MSRATSVSSTDLPADRALFGRLFDGLIATCYHNERPPRGLLGQLDWHFQGQISQAIRIGKIEGNQGECVYYPIRKMGHTLHLILVGSGYSGTPGERNPLSTETLEKVSQNIRGLGLQKIGFSRKDLGGKDMTSSQEKLFEGVSLWITP